MANTAVFLLILAALCATARSRAMLDIAGVEARAAPTTSLSANATGADPQLVFKLSYKFYCGPGTTDFTRVPFDVLDACCEKHDRCFTGNFPGDKQVCIDYNCNKAFADCASAVEAQCKRTKSKTAMCKYAPNARAYGNWVAFKADDCNPPAVHYKTDEELEKNSCKTKEAVKTKLDGNGIDYCKPPPSAPKEDSEDANDYYCNEDYADGCGEDYSCGANEDGDYVCE